MPLVWLVHTHTRTQRSEGNNSNNKVTKKGYKTEAKTKGIKTSEITSVCCGTHTPTHTHTQGHTRGCSVAELIHSHAQQRPLGGTLSDAQSATA